MLEYEASGCDDGRQPLGDKMEIAWHLKIRYGLERDPVDSEITAWQEATENLIAEGLAPDDAGDQAARFLLPGYRSRVLKAEADNVEALLRALAKK